MAQRSFVIQSATIHGVEALPVFIERDSFLFDCGYGGCDHYGVTRAGESGITRKWFCHAD